MLFNFVKCIDSFKLVHSRFAVPSGQVFSDLDDSDGFLPIEFVDQFLQRRVQPLTLDLSSEISARLIICAHQIR